MILQRRNHFFSCWKTFFLVITKAGGNSMRPMCIPVHGPRDTKELRCSFIPGSFPPCCDSGAPQQRLPVLEVMLLLKSSKLHSKSWRANPRGKGAEHVFATCKRSGRVLWLRMQEADTLLRLNQGDPTRVKLNITKIYLSVRSIRLGNNCRREIMKAPFLETFKTEQVKTPENIL